MRSDSTVRWQQRMRGTGLRDNRSPSEAVQAANGAASTVRVRAALTAGGKLAEHPELARTDRRIRKGRGGAGRLGRGIAYWSVPGGQMVVGMRQRDEILGIVDNRQCRGPQPTLGKIVHRVVKIIYTIVHEIHHEEQLGAVRLVFEKQILDLACALD